MDPASKIKAIVLRNRHALIFVSLLTTVIWSQLIAFLLRFEFAIPAIEKKHLTYGILLGVVCKLIVLYGLKQHRGFFNFSGLLDLTQILQATSIGSIVFAVSITLLDRSYPRSIFILDFLLTTAAICGMRVFVRLVREWKNREAAADHGVKNTLIYGAGIAGKSIVREIRANCRLSYRVVGFIDDNPHLLQEFLLGVRVYGSGEELGSILLELRERGVVVDEVIVAIPSATKEQLRRIVDLCQASGIASKTLPGLGELLENRNLSLQIRDINVEDLLGREKVDLEETSIRASLQGRVVMITGAAGSIGSDLAACIAEFKPKKLILFDISESPLFQVDMALRASNHGDIVVPIIGDIRDYRQLESVIRTHEVKVIFHAAAFKHVPLVEEHVLQGALNNVIGTYNLAEAAYENGVENFTLISSDKAVRPTNVMGATKRAAEMIIASYPRTGGTRFSAVRFGNVLGSNGSVIPTFKWQIARGGPVTVTHPDMTRYFMTIREAVQLVLQASIMSSGSDIFVLEMGEPVRIMDLAYNVIKLAGLQPHVDVPIEIIGLRPGEKLHEELIAYGESVVPTYHEKIKIFTGPSPEFGAMQRWIQKINEMVEHRDAPGVVNCLANLVPDYEVSDRWRDAIPKRPTRIERGVGAGMGKATAAAG